jgi:SAM-dependent methyltransferase
MADDRARGSLDEFERDWAEALRGDLSRRLIYPDPRRDEQSAIFEAVKARQILDALAAHGIRRGRMLEYGCGSAGMSIFLRERRFDAYAVDLLPSALVIARANDEAHRTLPTPLPLAQADAMRLPFADGAFDLVMSNGLLEHFASEPLSALLAEVLRVLRPGGLFIADMIPKRLDVRAVGNVLNFTASAAYHLARGRFGRLRELPGMYFEPYYETGFAPEEWERILREAGLRDVRVQVCRPFPPLAIRGWPEAAYTRVMRAMLPLWRRFDAADSWLTRRWGWMYLAVGVRDGADRT